MREGIDVEVSGADRARPEAVVADRDSPQEHVRRSRRVRRSRIVPAAADGPGAGEIVRRTGKAEPCVRRWRERFVREGVAGLLRDRTRPPRVAPLAQATIDRVVALTPAEPPGEATRWTATAAASGIGISPVRRIWRAHKLRPHRVRTFELSRGPAFAAKLRDIVGLYPDPPAHAVVPSVGEKPQLQAPTAPGPGCRRGRVGPRP
jgi:hypothetical protein